MKNNPHTRHIIVHYQDPKDRENFPREQYSGSYEHTEDQESEWQKTSWQFGDGVAMPSTFWEEMISSLER